MATLVVFKFPTAEGADTMLSTLEGLQKQQLIQIQDGAILSWPAGASKPKTRQLSKGATTGAGALVARSGDFCSACCSSSHSSAWRWVPRWEP